jgi:hypothetical protein
VPALERHVAAPLPLPHPRRWTWPGWRCAQASTLAELRDAMRGHVLAEAALVGTYAIRAA